MPAVSRRYVADVEVATTPFARTSRWFRELDPWVLDAVLGTAFTVLSLVGILANDDGRGGLHDPDVLGVALALGVGVPFYFRRHAPLTKAQRQTTWPSLKIGRYIATTRPPITTPRNTMISGSSRLDSAATASSTSRS